MRNPASSASVRLSASLLCVAAMLALAPAHAQDTAPGAMAPAGEATPTGDLAAIAGALSPQVEDVQLVGPWGENGSKGVWRTVMLRDPADRTRTHFFAQQLAGAEGQTALANSIEITEIAEIEGEIVGYRPDEPSEADPDGLTLFFEIVPLDGEIAETYQLNIFGDGAYDFGPATN